MANPTTSAASSQALRAPHQGPLVVTSRPDMWPIRKSAQEAMEKRPFQSSAPENEMQNHLPSISPNAIREWLEGQLPASFYTHPPPHCRAIFSTRHGELPFRTMDHLLPKRSLHLWDREEIQVACNSLRLMYWDIMRNLQRPTGWMDMWQWFDAYDMYFYGAQNLWNCVNHLYDENMLIHADFRKESALEIGHWADDWCAIPANQEKLKAWDERKGPIFNLFSVEDSKSMGPISDDVIPVLSDAIKHRRHLLLQDPELLEHAMPNHLMPACQSGTIHNWMGRFPYVILPSVFQYTNLD